MSSPFIYSPQSEFFPHFQQPSGFLGRPYHPSLNSPFIPTQTIYPSSPYLGPVVSDQGTPNTPLFSGLNDYGASMWGTPRRRQRRPSWHGTSTPRRVSPFIPPLHIPPSLDEAGRRDSWGNPEPHSAGWYAPAYPRPMAPPYSAPPFSAPPLYSAPLPSSYVSGYPQFPAPLQIHPWINGDSPSPEFVFDLSTTGFNPQRFVGPNQAVPLSMGDLQAPAFSPPVTKLRIVCDMIPNWPIDLIFGAGGMEMGLGGMQAPPITLGDILIAIHKKMHQRISHLDWARLSMSEETAISRAFTRRCRTESMRYDTNFHSDAELPERQQGVKVIDFLLGRNMFRGLVRSEDGQVRMIVS
ncbi:hypothetical protein DFH07DRAFT_803676 [Mycena maculata]|uniref:DUF6699 domain-containing protein n=1 Tax=Mycena maculata TaxID=230809 RepID=A0AAD7JUA0_9AGAR|nr:hypothetical protein DFH07DRAFT_803676 [Mycena maculata]